MEMRLRPRWTVASALLVVLVVASACGGDAETELGGDARSAATEEAAPEAEPTPDPSLPLVEVATGGRFAFDTERLEAPAEEPFQIMFRNTTDQLHNVSVYETLDGVPLFREPLFQGEIFQGPDTMLYEVPAIDPGTYIFYCDLHRPEGMKGEFVVG